MSIRRLKCRSVSAINRTAHCCLVTFLFISSGCIAVKHAPSLVASVLHETAFDVAGLASDGGRPSINETNNLERMAFRQGAFGTPVVLESHVTADEFSPSSKLDAPLSLADAIRVSLESDPKIRAAAEGVNQANADLWTVSLPPNPTLMASQTLNPLTRQFTPLQQGGPPQLDVGVYFPIDWLLFHKRQKAVDSARVGVDVAGADFADLVRQRLAGTVTAFYDVLEAKMLLELARQDLEGFKQAETITKQRIKQGELPDLEEDVARLAVFESEREVRKRGSAHITARANFQANLGLRGVAQALDVEGNLDVPAPMPPLSLKQAFYLAESYRPDLVSLRLKVAKAEADIQSERAKACPEVTPRVGYTRQFQKDIGYPDANSWGVGVDISLPFFNRNQGAISKTQSVLVQMRHNLDAQRVQAHVEIEQAAADLQVAHAALTDAPARLRTAQKVHDRVEALYKKKQTTLPEFILAQRAYREARRVHVMDQASYWRALYRLNTAIGKQVLQ